VPSALGEPHVLWKGGPREGDEKRLPLYPEETAVTPGLEDSRGVGVVELKEGGAVQEPGYSRQYPLDSSTLSRRSVGSSKRCSDG